MNTNTTESWIIRRTATYEHGGDSPKLFNFQCTSSVNDGCGLGWQRIDTALDITQVVITGAVELQLTQPVAGSAGTYRCTDTVTMGQSEFIILTTGMYIIITIWYMSRVSQLLLFIIHLQRTHPSYQRLIP